MPQTLIGSGFTLVRKVADGALTEVFLGRNPAGQKVGIKVLRYELVTNAEAVGRCLDEAEACRGFDHPNLIRVFDVGKLGDGRVFLVTEFLEGEDLGSHLRLKGTLTPTDLVRIAVPISRALAYAHKNRVIHRDLKPENIFLVGGLSEYQPKIIDFGLAHFRGNKSVKTAGVLLATPEYAAPECIQGQPAGPPSDLYALGCVMTEALSGSPPFVATSYGDLLLKHLNEPPPSPRNAPDTLAQVIRKCLAKRPADRFQNAMDLANALTGALGEADGAPVAMLDSTHMPLSGSGQSRLATDAEGQLFGDYRLLKRLGEGAMGEVFLAEHTRLGRQVAIKLLRAELAHSRDLVQRFFQEARAVNQINHEHIVEIYDFKEEANRVYTVMELLVGQTLADAAKKEGPLPIWRTASIVRQVCLALDAAHKLEVVHRDIKPDNVFLTQRSGQRDYVKVLDFGVAKLSRHALEAGSQRTMQGTILGTPAYMAPEQASGHAVDSRADLYAVGTMLYELVAGRVPFDGASFGELAVKLITQAPPPLPASTAAGEPIPAALKDLVLRCMEKDPARRPDGAAAVAERLTELAIRPSDDVVLLQRPRRRFGAIAAAVVAFPVVVGGAVFAWSLRQSAAMPADSPLAAAATPVASATPAPALAPPARPQPPSEVTLTLETSPQGATVSRTDSAEVLGTTPLELKAPRGGAEIPLRVQLDGFAAVHRVVRPVENQLVQIVLVKEKDDPKPKARPARKKPARGQRLTNRDDVLDFPE